MKVIKMISFLVCACLLLSACSLQNLSDEEDFAALPNANHVKVEYTDPKIRTASLISCPDADVSVYYYTTSGLGGTSQQSFSGNDGGNIVHRLHSLQPTGEVFDPICTEKDEFFHEHLFYESAQKNKNTYWFVTEQKIYRIIPEEKQASVAEDYFTPCDGLTYDETLIQWIEELKYCRPQRNQYSGKMKDNVLPITQTLQAPTDVTLTVKQIELNTGTTEHGSPQHTVTVELKSTIDQTVTVSCSTGSGCMIGSTYSEEHQVKPGQTKTLQIPFALSNLSFTLYLRADNICYDLWLLMPSKNSEVLP